jgi:GMP synthase-like glutamine amidotransferase
MILIIDMNWKKDSLGFYEFVLPIVSIVEVTENCAVKHYSDVSEEDTINCSKIILSGTALKDNVTLGQPEKFDWIRKVDKPILGICAGMQTIGVAFGLLLTRCLEIGMTQIITVSENPLFGTSFKAYSLHNYTVESSEEFEILAESEKCIQAMKHKQKAVFGVLFHPEVRNSEIIKRFVQIQETKNA